uniref:Uncharacterized protein n=1 Tax=Avena sativa TaxID=4498 RepID=A0ACD5YRZ6_AVESA
MCFEYLPNGSLDQYISGISSGLDWGARYAIIKGICEGLKCLHEGSKNSKIHMNLKLSNILLDENMTAKIDDFDIVRFLGKGKRSSIDYGFPCSSDRHMPPEFIQRQVISKAFDIYSLGIIVIGLVTGTILGLLEMPSAMLIEKAHEEWMQRLQKTVHVTSVEGYFQQVKKCLKIGLQCVERDRHRRPTITNIINALNETETLINCGLLVVHPQELRFLPFRTNKKAMISCTLELNNRGDDRVAFMLVANRPKMYLTKKPLCGIVPPRCAYSLTLTMMPNKIMELSSQKKIMGPPSSSSDCSDFFTLYSVVLGQYDLQDVQKDSVLVQYDNFFKKAKDKATGDEVQEVKLKVLCHHQEYLVPPQKKQKKQAGHGTSSEIIATPDAQQVSFIDVHPTEPWFMTTNHMGSLRLWNYYESMDRMQVEALNYFQLAAYEPVHVATFIAREKWIVAGDRNGDIHVYNYDQNQHVKSFDAHNSCITTLVVHPTDPFLLSSSEDDDHLIKLWSWNKDWKCTRTFQGHTDRVTEVAFNPMETDSFASISWDGTVKIWSICSDDPRNIITLKLDGSVERLLCIDYFTRYNQQHLIVGCKDMTVQIWKLGMKECVDKLEGHADHISAVKLHPDLPVLITGSIDGTIRIWNSTTYKLENIIGFNLGAVYALGCIKGSQRGMPS